MEIFAKNIRLRAKQLGFSNATVAEIAGLDARRYGHYVTGRNEPHLATVVRIARALKTTPNLLLGFGSDENKNIELLVSAAEQLNETQLQMLIDFADASLKKK